MFAVKQKSEFFLPVFLFAVLGLLAANTASAVTEPTVDYSAAELEELVGPVALYPDDLIAIILPASSYPLQIVEAARYLKEVEKNPDIKPADDWDDAVVALLNYPEVIALLNEDLDWTWSLGEAVVNQQAAVLDAIQGFRGRAVAAGNLETDDRQAVSYVDDVIEITPVDPEVIYVPYYEPSRVVIYQREPVYYYYPDAYPLYYYPYPAHYSFASGLFWGVTTAYTIGWLTDRVHYHHYRHVSHPYYGRHYTSHYYAHRAGRVRHHHYSKSHRHYSNKRRHYGNTWVPRYRHGDRPRHRHTAKHRRDGNASSFRGPERRHSPVREDRVRSGRSKRHRKVDGRRQVDSRRQVDGRRQVDSRRQVDGRRHVDDTRRDSRVAVRDRSNTRKPSRRTQDKRVSSGGKRVRMARNERSATEGRRVTRGADSVRGKRASRGRAGATANVRSPTIRQQPRQKNRQAQRQNSRQNNSQNSRHAQNTKRSTSEPRAPARRTAKSPPRQAKASGNTKASRNIRVADGRGSSRGSSGNRRRHRK